MKPKDFHKLKIGAKVKILDRKGGKYEYQFTFANNMAIHSGKIFTIKKIYPIRPDKCINALDKLVNEYLEENNKKE